MKWGYTISPSFYETLHTALLTSYTLVHFAACCPEVGWSLHHDETRIAGWHLLRDSCLLFVLPSWHLKCKLDGHVWMRLYFSKPAQSFENKHIWGWHKFLTFHLSQNPYTQHRSFRSDAPYHLQFYILLLMTVHLCSSVYLNVYLTNPQTIHPSIN